MKRRLLGGLLVLAMLLGLLPVQAMAAEGPPEDANWITEIHEGVGSIEDVIELSQLPMPFGLVDNLTYTGSYYAQLDASSKAIYDAIYAVDSPLRAGPSTSPITITGATYTDDADKSAPIVAALGALLYDHPELSWLVNTSFSYSTTPNKEIVSFSMTSEGYQNATTAYTSGNYGNADTKDRSTIEKAINEAKTEIGTLDNLSDYTKVKTIYDWICNHMEYAAKDAKFDNGWRGYQTAYSALVEKVTVCAGYAKSFKLLCDEYNIPCAIVTGTSHGQNHAWNYVRIGGSWYAVDCTWADQSTWIDYDYLLKGSKNFTDHTEGTLYSNFVFAYPELSETDYTDQNAPTAISINTPTTTVTSDKGHPGFAVPEVETLGTPTENVIALTATVTDGSNQVTQTIDWVLGSSDPGISLIGNGNTATLTIKNSAAKGYSSTEQNGLVGPVVPVTARCSTTSAKKELWIYVGQRTPKFVQITKSGEPVTTDNITAGESASYTVKVYDQYGQEMSDQTVSWSTSNSGVANVDNNGNVTAASQGDAAITATVGNATGTVDVTVQPAGAHQLTVPGNQTLTYGETKTAAATSSTGATISYLSSNSNVIVDANGQLTANKVGTATITATAPASGVYTEATATFTVTVNPKPLTASTVNVTLNASGLVYNGSAHEPSVTVTDSTAATITTSDYTVIYSNNTSAGTAKVTVTAVEGGNYTGSVDKTFTINKADSSLTVNPTNLNLSIGNTGSFTATLTEPSETITAASSNPAIATVSGSGSSYTVDAVAEGTAEITVSFAGNQNYNAVSKTVTVTVTSKPAVADSVTISGATADGKAIYSTKLTAKPVNSKAGAALAYQWLRDGTPISGATGTTYTVALDDIGHKLSVRVSGGDSYADVTSSTVDATAISVQVALTVSPTTIKVGQTATASVTVTTKDGASIADGTVTYTSSNPAVATVNNEGDITATNQAGTTNITAQFVKPGYETTSSAPTVLTVEEKDALTVSIPDVSLAVDDTATVSPSVSAGNVSLTSTDYDVTYTVAAGNIAAVDVSGTVTGKNFGTTAVTATVTPKGPVADNYHTTTKEFKVVVTSKTVTPTVTVTTPSGGFVYNGNAHTPALTVTADSNALTKDLDYTVTWANNVNAGTATVTVSPVANRNYTWTPVTENFTIDKANPIHSNVTIQISYADMREKTITASMFGLTGDDIVFSSGGPVTDTGLAAGYPSYGPDIKIKLEELTEDSIEQTIVIPISFTSANYNLNPLTLTVEITPKIVADLTIVLPDNLTYDGSPKSVTVTSDQDGSEGYDALYEYDYSGADTLGNPYSSQEAPVNAGTYTVTVSIPDSNGAYAGTAAETFVIERAAAIITADDKTIYVGDMLPDYTYTVEPAGITLPEELTVSSIATDSNTSGRYDIIISCPESSDDGNYSITCQTGTLTILPIIVAVPAATPNGGSFTGSQQVTLTCATEGAEIYYTTDGSVPTAGSTRYTSAITLTGTVTLKAIAVKYGVSSEVLTAIFTLIPNSNIPSDTNPGGGNSWGPQTTTPRPTTRPTGGGTSNSSSSSSSASNSAATSPGSGTTSPSNNTAAPAPVQVTVPVSSDQAAIQISAAISGNTAAVTEIDTAQIENVIANDAHNSSIEMDFSNLNTAITTVELPAQAISKIAETAQSEDHDVSGLTIKLSGSEITFDNDALKAISPQSGTLTLTIAPAEASDLNARQRDAAGDAPVFDLTLQSAGKAITSFGEGTATISLPYSLKEGQNPAGIVVYYLDDSGNIHACETTYDVHSETVTFTTNHLSLYFVGYDETAAVQENPFSDVNENDWYYDAVLWAVGKGITTGTTSSTFSPKAVCSRAQMVTFLYRCAGTPDVGNAANPFTDVKEDDWYYDAVMWAVSEGITTGTTAETFAPDEDVTRAQTVLFLYRYMKTPAVRNVDNPFTDVGDTWYTDAVLWAASNGITTGTTNTTFSPDANCERGQIVTLLYRMAQV